MLIVLGFVACARNRGAEGAEGGNGLAVHVDYTPTGTVDIESVSWVRPGMRVRVEPVVDTRPEPGKLGENVEGARVPVTESVQGLTVRAVETALHRELQGLGLQLVATAAEAERVLQVSIVRLWVSEDNTYNAEFRMTVEVRGAGGEVYASVLAAGTAKRFGSSLSEANYNEAWSSAFMEAFENVVEDPKFGEAMGPNAVPAESQSAEPSSGVGGASAVPAAAAAGAAQ